MMDKRLLTLPKPLFLAIRAAPFQLVSITYVRAPGFHGGNTGSNPVGDARCPWDRIAPFMAEGCLASGIRFSWSQKGAASCEDRCLQKAPASRHGSAKQTLPSPLRPGN